MSNPFELLPTIDRMLDLYAQPRTFERFQEYLNALQGNTKGDLAVPLQGFNPMAKELAPQKLIELQALGAEAIIGEVCKQLNAESKADHLSQTFKIALNLSDDLQGGWTNRYTSDYQSKFQLQALVKRGFCTPIFWTSETYTRELIRQRILEYAYRSWYWLQHPKPGTLAEHLAQECFVVEKTGNQQSRQPDFDLLAVFYATHRDRDSYPLIFNFFYGDEASQSLGFPSYGVARPFAGFEFARQVSKTGDLI